MLNLLTTTSMPLLTVALARLSSVLLAVCGWRIEGSEEVRTNRHSVGVYCHTSAWDGIIGMLVACVLRDRLGGYGVSFVMRESLVRPLSGATQRAIAIAQVCKGRGGSIQQLIARFRDEKPTCVLISPEGSRFRTSRWHTGPFVLARTLGADVLSVGIDYCEHVVRIRRLSTTDPALVKDEVARDSMPLYASETTLDIPNPSRPTGVMDWLVATSYAMGISVLVWRGGEAARAAMCCSTVACIAYHNNHEASQWLRRVDHGLAWLAVLMAFRDYTLRYASPSLWALRAVAWGLAFVLKMASTTGGFRETSQYRTFHSLFHLSIVGIAATS